MKVVDTSIGRVVLIKVDDVRVDFQNLGPIVDRHQCDFALIIGETIDPETVPIEAIEQMIAVSQMQEGVTLQ